MELERLVHIDLFSGPGGICTGFRAAGLETIVAIEKVRSCADTYSANHPDVDVINKDIRLVTDQELLEKVGGRKVDIITSGMPCETFSTAGSTSRSSYDFRQQLYSEAIRLAKCVNAELILFENVPAILTKRVSKEGSRLVVEDIIEELEFNGYNNHKIVILNARDFGVPQNRKRFFLIASKNKDFQFEIPCSDGIKLRDVEMALGGLPLMEANDKKDYTKYVGKDSEYTLLMKDRVFWKSDIKTKESLSYHIAPKHRQGTIERFKLIEPGESLVSLFKKFDEQTIAELQSKRVLPKKWYIQRNKRLKINEPSKTVTSHCLDELVHPILDRSLTVREVARLQSFPDFYDFKGGPYLCPHMSEVQDKYEQIGDAVPPLLAYHWGVAIRSSVKNSLELCLI